QLQLFMGSQTRSILYYSITPKFFSHDCKIKLCLLQFPCAAFTSVIINLRELLKTKLLDKKEQILLVLRFASLDGVKTSAC
ncbi:MAG: hypothetical protein MUC47_01565, partial [Candidatus Kapabacteria bacterium]|nr:hypothetical protein [Candidatus Kapabacteria bacterium]